MTEQIKLLESKINQGIIGAYKKQTYEIILIVCFIFKNIINILMLLMPLFIFMNPLFECNGVPMTEQKACLIIDQCKITNDFTAVVSTHLYCENQDFRSVIQSFVTLGTIVGMLTIVPFADFGCKRVTILITYLFSIFGALMTFLGIYYINWTMIIIGQLLGGISYSGFDIVSHVMMAQYLRDNLCQIGLILTCAALGFGQALFLPIYYYIPDWYKFLIYVILIPNIILMLVSYYVLIQHPTFFLFKNRDIDSFSQSLEELSKFNEGDPGKIQYLKQLGIQYLQIIQKQNLHLSSPKQQIKEHATKLFCNRQNVISIICLTFIYAGFNFYLMNIQDSMQRTGFNFGVTAFMNGFVQFLSYLLFNFFGNKIKRKLGLAVTVLGGSFFGLLFLTQQVKQSVVIQSVVFCITIVMSTVIYSFIVLALIESFDFQIMSTAQGVCQSIGSMFTMFVPYEVIKMNDLGIHPIVGSSIFLLVLGFIPIYFLRETLGTFKANPDNENFQIETKEQSLNSSK